MKKLRKLSVYKKKKASLQDDTLDDIENEQASSNQSKNYFSQTLKKKFFSKKGSCRSKSASSAVTSFPNKKDLPHDEKEKKKARNSFCFETIVDVPSHTLAEINGNVLHQTDRLLACTSVPGSNDDEADNSGSDHDEQLSSDDIFDDHKSASESSPEQVEHGFDNDATFFSPAAVTALNSYLSNTVLEFKRLAKQGWYWGPLTRIEAEEKLQDSEDGSFLVSEIAKSCPASDDARLHRDSSDERYLLSLSFRSHGRTLHTRIEHSRGKFSFYNDSGHPAYTSVVELMKASMRESEHSGVFCYPSSRSPASPVLPVRLCYPVSRLLQVRSLQYLCRFVIRQFTRIDHIQQLPLPNFVKGYVEESYF